MDRWPDPAVPPRSKNDQEGEGYELWLPRADDPAMCPVTALSTWRTHVASLVGGDPITVCPKDPVFIAVDRYGRARWGGSGRLRRLDEKCFNEMVQRHAVSAGLATPPKDPAERARWRNPFGGHSCRVGFVHEALRQGLSIAQVAEVTRHRDMNTLMRYKREHDRRSNNPVKELLVAAGLAA
jgi:hypothetical protein